MGLIKEPKGVDFIINSEPLTKEQEEKLSEFIAKRKREIAEMKKHVRLTKAKSKRAKIAKTKPKSKQEN
ncbi:MAG: hypothetical protein AAF632_20110 [Bacteroidota bacterium]